MFTSLSFWVGIGLSIIVALAAYAIYLHRQLRAQKRLADEKAAKREQARLDQHRYIEESIRVIAANVIEEDLNLSEATIRCKILLDGLILTESERAPYVVLDEVFEKVKEFDTHQSRKDLSKQERRAQDASREAIETEYESLLKACFQELRKFEAPSLAKTLH